MAYPLTKVGTRDCSPLLLEIPDPPEGLYIRGSLPPPGTIPLAVVGSRDYTDYGKRVAEYLIMGLRGQPISIISGLAIGMDTIAHRAALEAGLHTIAVPGSGLDDTVLYPRRNRALAERILTAGGCLLSEFEPTFAATLWSFPKRNRIMAGLSKAVLLIEAGERSGTLITARLAAEYNREVLVVPGSIFSENSRGVHQFLRLGATPVTSSLDILDALGLPASPASRSPSPSNPEEKLVLDLLTEPKDHDAIIRSLPFPPARSIVLLTELELRGIIRESNGVYYRI